MNKQNIVVKVFEGNKVQFNVDGYINATFIAKKHGKRANDFLQKSETAEYVAALLENQLPDCGVVKQIQALIKQPITTAVEAKLLSLLKQTNFVITKSGAPSTGGGTWIHPKLAVYFARWISIKFAIWCDTQIEQILKEQHDTPEQRRIDEIIKLLTDTVDLMDFEQMSFSERRAQREFTWEQFQTFFGMKRNTWFARCVVGMINRRIIGMSATQFRARVLGLNNQPRNLTRDFLPKPIQECIMWVTEELLDYFQARPLWTRTLVTAKIEELCITKRGRMERLIGRNLHELAEECIDRVQAYAEEFNISPYEVINQNLIQLNYDRLALQRHFREQAMKK